MEQETEFESLCRKCGLCCHIKVGLLDGTVLVHPTATCKFQDVHGTCSIYGERFTINPACRPLEQILDQEYVLPEGCPYTHLRPGYKTAKVVTLEEFNRITLEDLLQGSCCLASVNEILNDPDTNYKIIDLEEETRQSTIQNTNDSHE